MPDPGAHDVPAERLSASLYLNRVVCGNGMVVGSMLGRIRFRHDRNAAGWEDEVARVMAVVKGSADGGRAFAQAMSKLAAATLTSDHLRALRRGGLSSVPLTIWAKALDRTLLHEEPTLWGLVNGATYTLWHDAKQTVRDLDHNEAVVTALLRYAGRLN